MKKIHIFLISIVSIFTSVSNAQNGNSSHTSGVYVQAGVVPLMLKYNQYNYNLGTTGTALLGYDFSKYMAAEIMYASSSTADYSTTLSFTAFYLKPKYPINDTFEIQRQLGSNNMVLSSSYSSATKSFTSYGLGLTAYLGSDKKQYLAVDYMVWGDNNGYSLISPALTYGFRF